MHLTWLHIMWPTPFMGHRGCVGIMCVVCVKTGFSIVIYIAGKKMEYWWLNIIYCSSHIRDIHAYLFLVVCCSSQYG